ncbi:aldose epimerase family protein [Clostridium sp.]|uniref:aldose epimerase family protein n=1 Tax=Clostridium sp. TaxID=1506 RepID=UPI002606AD12|nr:aldose epimerase family protein [Clostridium sp.]
MIILEEVISKVNERDIISINIKNSKGFELKVLNFGGIITDILVPDKNEKIENVVLKYENMEDYKENSPYYGGFIGRTSGRIANGKVNLNGEELNFYKNYGINQGHGGKEGFNKKIFNYKIFEEKDQAYVEFYYLSKDKEEGYPGNLEVKVRYTVTENNEVKINYYGTSDKDTLVNLTNHSYFNLSGNREEDILKHSLYIDSEFIFEINENQVPSGNIINVEETAFDFKIPKLIGRDINKEESQMKIGNGYDHPWVLNSGYDPKLKLYHKGSGRLMEMYTDQNSVVLYTLNYPEDKKLEGGKLPLMRGAVAIESQSPPIGEDNTFIKYSILKKDEEYKKETIYKFSIL